MRIKTDRIRWASLVSGSAALMSVLLLATQLQAQESEVWAQKPFIMLLVDTSGSMEWTNEGDEFYPSDGRNDPWELSKPLQGTGMETYYGPCRVWAHSCNTYERPSWQPSELSSSFSSALSDMRGGSSGSNPGHRLQVKSQPRHISLKETLTGDMILRPQGSTQPDQSLTRDEYGPGCWLVPRQRGAANNGDICLGSEAFERYPDHNDPLPHFQEVFDFQKENGLMDLMGTHAIFGLGMLDSYPDSHKDLSAARAPSDGWEGGTHGSDDINDLMSDDFAGILEGEGGPAGLADNDNYNLGIYQLLVPNRFDDMNPTQAGHISSFIQTALLDSGYLAPMSADRMLQADDGQVNISEFMSDYQRGRQPIARATPLAAAIYDTHQFFAEGRGDGSDGPVREDPYLQCRPKQVVVVTDGMPEPELPGGEVKDLPSVLNPTFGYNPEQYPYARTEDTIDFFLNDYAYGQKDEDGTFDSSDRAPSSSYLAGSWNAGASDEYKRAVKYNPRVHIVGINAVNEDVVIRKMAEMAIAGKSCAEYYLKKDWIPTTHKDFEGNTGTCNPSSEFCLDPAQAEYVKNKDERYKYLTPDDYPDKTINCNYPAFILKEPSNYDGSVAAGLVARTKEGLQLLFNQIVAAGMSSRTRPTYVNRLDDPGESQGGQFSYFTGTTIDAGQTFWRGRLYRRANLCAPEGKKTFSELSEEINEQAGLIEYDTDTHQKRKVKDDQRRIFTTLSTWNPYYTTDPTTGYSGSLTDSRFGLGMDLGKSAVDQFGEGYLGVIPGGLEGTRIPFLSALVDAYNNVTNGMQNKRTLEQYFNAPGEALEDLIDEVRGRSEKKQGRALGAILNASPVAVEPPDQALPIDSYRDFQARYANRPSMLYVSTTDGLLHAIHAGQLPDSEHAQVALQPDESYSSGGSTGTMSEQREAWAYLPQMLHPRLQDYKDSPPELLDGTPTVKDVRLCHLRLEGESGSLAYLNTSAHACDHKSDAEPESSFQWRTVLVAGLGEFGAGYFALDVTRPGGEAYIEKSYKTEIVNPDPIALWEFDREWERAQLNELIRAEPKLVAPSKSSLKAPQACEEGQKAGWAEPYLGRSVGTAAIGTVVVDARLNPIGDTLPVQRPVAVIGGGLNKNPADDCEKATMGKAIYVLDMQSGSILRRFVSYLDEQNQEQPFEVEISGSPALYDGSPGSLATRGFIGDARGRLFRLDMADPDPEKWHVKLFFDPAEDLDNSDYDEDTVFGPAAFKPAIAKSTTGLNNDLLVFYGLGEGTDLSADGSTQVMIAVREKVSMSATSTVKIEGEEVWHHEFTQDTSSGSFEQSNNSHSEALTSEPVVFNGGVYFTTFVEPTEDRCAAGWSRIYGLKFQGDYEPEGSLPAKAEGLFHPYDPLSLERPQIPKDTECVPSSSNCMAYQPTGTSNLTESVVVRGLTVSMGLTCLPEFDEENYDETTSPVQSAASSQTPVLMAQSTSDKLFGEDKEALGSTSNDPNGADTIFAGSLDLAEPRSQFIPLSWALIDN